MNLDQYRQESRDGILRVNELAGSLAASLDDAALNAPPKQGDWTIGQVFEHMILAQEPYLAKVRDALAKAGPETPGLEPKHSFFGKFIIGALTPGSSRKVPVPKAFEPPNGPFTREVIDRFFRVQDQTLQLVEQTKGLDINKTRMSSPAAGFIKISVTDIMKIVVLHNEYHLGQVRDLIAR